MAAVPAKRNKLDLSKKLAILEKLESGKKQVEVAQEFNLPKTTVQTIWIDRDKITQRSCEFSPSAMRNRDLKFPKTEAALVSWFDEQRAKNIPINGPILKEKGRKFAEELDKNDFKGNRSIF